MVIHVEPIRKRLRLSVTEDRGPDHNDYSGDPPPSAVDFRRFGFTVNREATVGLPLSTPAFRNRWRRRRDTINPGNCIASNHIAIK